MKPLYNLTVRDDEFLGFEILRIEYSGLRCHPAILCFFPRQALQTDCEPDGSIHTEFSVALSDEALAMMRLSNLSVISQADWLQFLRFRDEYPERHIAICFTGRIAQFPNGRQN